MSPWTLKAYRDKGSMKSRLRGARGKNGGEGEMFPSTKWAWMWSSFERAGLVTQMTNMDDL